MPTDRPRIRVLDWVIGGAIGGALLLTGNRRRELAILHSGRGRRRTPPSPRALGAGHETVDADAGRVGQVLVGLAVVVILSVGALGLLLSHFHGRHAAHRPQLTAQQQASVQPPLPRLQVRAYADLRSVQAHEQALLHGYAWQDAQHGRAKIPIDRAMALMVGRSLAPLP